MNSSTKYPDLLLDMAYSIPVTGKALDASNLMRALNDVGLDENTVLDITNPHWDACGQKASDNYAYHRTKRVVGNSAAFIYRTAVEAGYDVKAYFKSGGLSVVRNNRVVPASNDDPVHKGTQKATADKWAGASDDLTGSAQLRDRFGHLAPSKIEGVRLMPCGNLIYLIYDFSGNVCGHCERSDSGFKHVSRFGDVKTEDGWFSIIGASRGNLFNLFLALITEGFTDAFAAFDSTGIPVIITGGINRLRGVVEHIHKSSSIVRLINVCDIDLNEPDLLKQKGVINSNTLGIEYSLPVHPETGERFKDVNDMLIACNFDRELVRAALMDRVKGESKRDFTSNQECFVINRQPYINIDYRELNRNYKVDTFITSDCGTGKSAALVEFVQSLPPGTPCYYISFRRSLIRAMSERLGLEYYEDLKGVGGDNTILRQCRRLGISIQSLHLLRGAIPSNAVLIIDEVEQVLVDVVTNRKLDNHRIDTLQTLIDLISNCDKTISLDAHLGDITRDFFRGLGRAKIDIINTAKTEEGKTYYLVNSYKQLDVLAYKAIKRGKKVDLVFNSATKACSFYKGMDAQDQDRTFLITNDAKMKSILPRGWETIWPKYSAMKVEDEADRIKMIGVAIVCNEDIRGYNFLHSPSTQTGVSVDYDRHNLIEGYAWMQNGINNAEDVFQHIHRTRGVDDRYIAIKPSGVGKVLTLEDRKRIEEDTQWRCQLKAEVAGDTLAHKVLASLVAGVMHRRDLSFNNFRERLIEVLKGSGADVVELPEDYVDLSEYVQPDKAGKLSLADARKEVALIDIDPNFDEVDGIGDRDGLDWCKQRAAKVAPQNISIEDLNDLAARDYKRQSIKKLYQLFDHAKSSDELMKRDLDKVGQTEDYTNYKHLAIKGYVNTKFNSCLGLDRYLGFIDGRGCDMTAVERKSFRRWCGKYGYKLVKAGVASRADLERALEDPEWMIRKRLKLLGDGIFKSVRVGNDRKETRKRVLVYDDSRHSELVERNKVICSNMDKIIDERWSRAEKRRQERAAARSAAREKARQKQFGE